ALRRGRVAPRWRLKGRRPPPRREPRRHPPYQPEAAEGGRLEHVLHQLGRRRRGEPRRKYLRRWPWQERRLVRLGGGRQGGSAARPIRARIDALGSEKNPIRHPN